MRYNKKKNIILLPVVLGFILFCSGYPANLPGSNNEKIDKYLLEQLSQLKKDLLVMQNSCQKKASRTVLQQQFRQARYSFKKMAVLTDHFNPYETKFLNGPNLERVEEDHPDNIISAHGFQVLEEYLFGEWKTTVYELAQKELLHLLAYLERLTNETDRVYKFRDDEVWQAILSSIIRLNTLGISGFDSPIAENSIVEAKATLTGIYDLLKFYKPLLDNKNPGIFSQLGSAITKANQFLSLPSSFDRFDRLRFITNYINPLSISITNARDLLDIAIPGGRKPLAATPSIFDKDAFDIAFFSPERHQPTSERIVLGRQLFNDPILSGNNSRSCASCHHPGKAFTDGLPTALAMDEKKTLARNTPTLWNSVFQTRQFYDSRTSVLENQLSAVVHNEEEMKGSLKESITVLMDHPGYATQFRKAYANDPSPVTEYNIANAISSYVRSLVAMDSKFDAYMRGKGQLTTSEKNGFNLFMGKAKCGTCHFAPLFNGLVPPDFVETESEVLGVPRSKERSPAILDEDPGKFSFTGSTIHKHAFKTPSLRNIGLTAPYMHNGVYATLEEVMEFYNNGGGKGLGINLPNQTLPPDKLDLSPKEIRDIIAFMRSLTDNGTNKTNLP